MLRSLAIALLAGSALAFPVFAQAPAKHLFDGESNEAKMEFLRNLRKRGYSAIAKEFIDRQLATASKEDAPLWNLELARTSVALAKEEALGQRAEMLEKARAAFEPFIKANPNSPAGAQARLEMAKLYALQASMALNKAYLLEDEEDQYKAAKKARDLYDAADAEYVEAIKVLSTLKQPGELVEAEFDRANNLLEKANAFISTSNAADNRKRAETVDEARKIFAPIAKDTSTAQGLLANAYLVKCYQEGQDPSKVNEHYAIVSNAAYPGGATKSIPPMALPAIRLAQYFKILYMPRDPSATGDRVKKMIEGTQAWLKDYPSAKRTYEGEHLRFEYALMHLQMAGGATKGFKADEYKKLPTKEKLVVDQNIDIADKIALELKREGGDFSERGEGLNVEITRLNIKLDRVKSADNFDAALLRVKLKFQEAAKEKEGPGRAKLFNEAQDMLRDTIALGERQKVSPAKLHEAQFILGSALYGMNDRRRSAIVFESLARANPPSKKGAEAAGFAIELYRKFADDDNDDSARYYLRELGDFILGPSMQRLWAGDPVFGVTRYNLAMDYLSTQKPKLAAEHLSKMPKDFPAFIYSQGQGVFICMQIRETEETPEAKKKWTDEAKGFITRMGSLPASADATTTLMWFLASLEMPKFLYAEAAELLRDGKEKDAQARYADMSKAIVAVESAFKKDGGKLADDRKESIDFTIEVLKKYSQLGAADIEYRRGNYARVLEDDMLGGIVREVFEKSQSPGDVRVVDVRVVGESLSLVLRSFVQLGKLDQANGVYKLLMRIKPASGGGDVQDNANFTRALIQDLAQQADEMKKNNETVKLKELVGKFTVFGDALAKTLVYDKKNPELIDVKNLIRFYTSLDQFKKAADLIKTVPEPKFLNQKNLKANDDQERDLFIYWDFQIEHGRLLRLSKDWEGSNKILTRVVTHPNTRGQTIAKMEQIHIYADMGSYGQATKQWREFMSSLNASGSLGDNKRMQEMYFDAYFHNVVCFHKLSQTPKAKMEGKTETYLNLAAQLIVRLQNSKDALGWSLVGPKFLEYMSRERQLKTAYDAALKASK